MAYQTYNEQVIEHIKFLHEEGLDVNELEIGTKDFVRCREIGQTSGRGEFAYTTKQNSLRDGRVGFVTICRGRNGRVIKSTYGVAAEVNEHAPIILNPPISDQIKGELQKHEMAAKKAYGFWMHSNSTGTSDYLDSKKVGYYGIRFRNNKYGKIAVVPMRDIDGRLWSYQLLNPKTDPTVKNKIFATDSRTKDLFHFLKPIVDGQPFGIAESYVTAATCLELTGLSMVCVFSSNNLKACSLILRKRYPNSKIILFADNDRHLAENKGVLKAQAAQAALKENVEIAIPDFVNIASSKDASDWNDLVRLCETVEAKKQLKALGSINE